MQRIRALFSNLFYLTNPSLSSSQYFPFETFPQLKFIQYLTSTVIKHEKLYSGWIINSLFFNNWILLISFPFPSDVRECTKEVFPNELQEFPSGLIFLIHQNHKKKQT